jgi:hypothetical protein
MSGGPGLEVSPITFCNSLFCSCINSHVLYFQHFSPEEGSSRILSLSRLGYFTPGYKAKILLTLPSLLRPPLASSATKYEFHNCPSKTPRLLSLTWPLPARYTYTFSRPSHTSNTTLFSSCLLVRWFSP